MSGILKCHLHHLPDYTGVACPTRSWRALHESTLQLIKLSTLSADRQANKPR